MKYGDDYSYLRYSEIETILENHWRTLGDEAFSNEIREVLRIHNKNKVIQTENTEKSEPIYEKRKKMILEMPNYFFCLIPQDEKIQTAENIYDNLINYLSNNKSLFKGELLIDLALLKDKIGAVALCGQWGESGFPIAHEVDKIDENCSYYSDNEYTFVRKSEYMNRISKIIKSEIIYS